VFQLHFSYSLKIANCSEDSSILLTLAFTNNKNIILWSEYDVLNFNKISIYLSIAFSNQCTSIPKLGQLKWISWLLLAEKRSTVFYWPSLSTLSCFEKGNILSSELAKDCQILICLYKLKKNMRLFAVRVF
jgi:hypothetical protein